MYAAYFDKPLPLRPEDQGIDPAGFATPDALHTLLERQHYRLGWWRTANDTINWRRFFDVSDLIALKQDADGVFEATHAKIFEFYRDGLIDGLRIDHVDGIADPPAYCQRLRAELNGLAAQRKGGSDHPYIIVEKILGTGESLPQDWSVDGTTGYEFMNDDSALQHDPAGARPLAQLWSEISGRAAEFNNEETAARSEVVQSSFESALTQTTRAFFALARSSQGGRDITEASVRRAIVLILQHLGVYRTYATGLAGSPPPGVHFEDAIALALEHAEPIDQAAITYIAEIFRGFGEAGHTSDAIRRFNQLSSPVAAKAVEDTAFYRYGRLLSRNDVGFDPGCLSRSSKEFHAVMAERSRCFPYALLSTATHDHKRGEDVRARLAVLSELPLEWAQAVREWMALNTQRRGGFDPGDEYQLYQTLVGAWPLELRAEDSAGVATFCERIGGWQLKALREAKLRTSWLNPDEAYEEGAIAFLRAILDRNGSQEFLGSLHGFVQRIAPAGALNGLAQAALRCTLPGVPDCYQGTEFWDFSLVDPDNRRPVDYGSRIEAVQAGLPPSELLRHWRDGRVKQSLISTLLKIRREKSRLFDAGSYVPLDVRGERAGQVLAFTREADSDRLIVAVPLHCVSACADTPLPPPEFWRDTQVISPDQLRNVEYASVFDNMRNIRGENLICSDLFARFPVAVLVSS